MQKALIICYSHHASEPRLLREVTALKGSFTITTAGYSGLGKEHPTAFVKLNQHREKPARIPYRQSGFMPLRKMAGLIEKIYLQVFRRCQGYFFSRQDFNLLRKESYSLVISHHPNSLELAARLAKRGKAKLILNCHEYYPLEFDNKPNWMRYDRVVIEKILKRYSKKVDLWLTVSPHIQAQYETQFGARCFLMLNSKPYLSRVIRPVNEKTIRVIHHGGAMRERELERMIDVFSELPPTFRLDMMLTPTDETYLNELKEKFCHLETVSFRDPVPITHIVDEISRYDVGLFFLNDSIFNYKYCLPNKLFEFIQARLCVVITPNPEMKALVERYHIGYVADSYEKDDCVKVLKGLTAEKINAAKQHCEQAARALDAAKSDEMFLNRVKQLCAA